MTLTVGFSQRRNRELVAKRRHMLDVKEGLQTRAPCLEVVESKGHLIFNYFASAEDEAVALALGFKSNGRRPSTRDPRVAVKLIAHASEDAAAHIIAALLEVHSELPRP